MRLNHMFKPSVAILVLLAFAVLCAAADSAWASSRIVNVSLKKEGDFTSVAVYGDGPFEFSHSTEEAKGGKPYRVIIDCQDAIFDLPQHNFREGLPSGTITAIRTSQFQADPERIVRIVLDLKGPVVYKVCDRESETEVNIAVLTKKDPDFPMWVAVLEEKGERGGSISTQKRQASASAGETVSKRQKTRKSQALESVTQSAADRKASRREAAKLVKKRSITNRAVSYADTGESAKIRPPSLSRMKWEREDRVNPGSLDEIETSKSRASAKPSSGEASQASVADRKARPLTWSASKQERSRGRYLRRQVSRSPLPLGPFPEDRASQPRTPERTTVTQAGAEGSKGVSSDAQRLIQEGIGKILGPEAVSAKETEVLMESLTVIQRQQGSALGLTPERKMVYYKPGTRRDPFLPISEKGQMTFGAAPLPLFENLTLVGVLKDEAGNRALLEDELGFGYILMSGDRIKNGYLISVDSDKAFFHVEEYGGYQIMVLELKRE
jgi:hypothetical protein